MKRKRDGFFGRDNSLLLQFLDRGRVGPVLIDIDDPWALMLGSLQHLAEEAFGCPRISFCAEHEVNRLAGGIEGAVEVVPFPYDFDLGLIDSVGVIGRPQVRA